MNPVFLSSQSSWLRVAAALCIAMFAACAGRDTISTRPISIAIVGDTGYTYDYLEADDLDPPLTTGQRLGELRRKWIEDRRPIAEFEPPPLHRVGPQGAVVAGSGLLPVAHAMRAQCAEAPRCDFAVMLGDNIYPEGATLGADGKDDAERFRKLFAEPFGELFGGNGEARIYTVLGNHDWKTSRAGAQAQVDYHARTAPFHMNGFFYRAVPPGLEGEVEIFALDTHLMLGGLEVYEEELAADGGELAPHEREAWQPWAVPQNDAERGMAQWLEQALRVSTARWKIVIGHHPLWSSAGGKFEQARVLRRVLLPTLCRYADVYLAGHDHTLEVHTDDCRDTGAPPEMAPLPQLVSGAGAKQRGINSAFMRNQLRVYPQLRTLWAHGMTWGFAQLVLQGDRAQVRIISTPDDGSGARVTEFVHDFDRRTRLLRAGDSPGGER